MTPKQREARQRGIVLLVTDQRCIGCGQTGQPVYECFDLEGRYLCQSLDTCDQGIAKRLAERASRREDMPCP